LFLERWHDLLSEVLEMRIAAGDHRHDEARDVLKSWSGHANPTDAAYRLVHAFRAQLQARVYFMLIGPARRLAPDFAFEIPSAFEGPLWRLVRQRPVHLLAAKYADWDALLLEALVASEHPPAGCVSLSACTWGQVNAVHVTHPLSRALPALAGLLDMRVAMVPGGHADMPRVQGEDYGASERFSVSPGHEAEGYFHMPGGQSGHPLSPFYRGDFEAWANGTPTPFLPGVAAHSLQLAP
jgi:penicillin amidase